MEPERRRMLEAVMAELAVGDTAAVWTLSTEFNSELTKTVAARLRSIGRADVCDDESTMAGIVVDIGFLMLGVAHSWSPSGGALPWVWARHAINRLISDTVGHRAMSIDESQAGGLTEGTRSAEAVDESLHFGAGDIDLDQLAAREPKARLLRDAIAAVASERDQRVHIEYRMQHADGDPSPSHTVADAFGLGAANVRQIDRRVRNKLSELVKADDAYAELEGLPWLA